MPRRDLVLVNDPRLRAQAAPVERFLPELARLAQDMLDTMHAHHGLGLAGPQIGVMRRIFVAHIPAPKSEEEEPLHPRAGETFVFVNPRLTRRAPDMVEGEEGCLSIPGWRGLVSRPAWVEVTAYTAGGEAFSLTADGLLARIIQHEMDHLDGVLYPDHITDRDKLWQIDVEGEPPAVELPTKPPAV